MRMRDFTSARYAMRVLLVFAASLVLTSCGGGGGSGGGGTSTTPTAADPTGYYGISGTMSAIRLPRSLVDSLNVQGIVENNQILLFTSDGIVFYDIHISNITSNDFTGMAKVYQFSSLSQSSADLTVSGTITEGSSITGTFGGRGAFGQGTFTLVYNDQMGTIPMTSNNWSIDILGNVIDFNTDGAGAIADGPKTTAGVLFANCSIIKGGTTSEIGTSKIFKVALTLAGGTCGFAGDYTGYLVAQDATPTALAMAIVSMDGSKALGASFVHEP